MARVREAARVDAVVERRRDLVGDDHAAERDVARVHALGEADEVGRDVPALDREPLAAAPEAGHHLVGDEHDAVAVAEVTHALQVAGRRHEDAVGAHDRLEDDRRDRVRTLEHHDLVEVRERPLALLGLGRRVERRAVEVRAHEVDDPGHRRLRPPPARVAGRGDRSRRRPVVAAVHREDLLPAGVQARHAHRVLGRLRAAVGEEDLLQPVGRDLGDQAGGLAAIRVGVDRRHRAEATGGLLDRGDELRVLMPEVDVDQLRAEVQVPVAVEVPHPRALGAGDRHGADLGLRGPRVEHVAPVVRERRVGGAVVGTHRPTVARGGDDPVPRLGNPASEGPTDPTHTDGSNAGHARHEPRGQNRSAAERPFAHRRPCFPGREWRPPCSREWKPPCRPEEVSLPW